MLSQPIAGRSMTRLAGNALPICVWTWLVHEFAADDGARCGSGMAADALRLDKSQVNTIIDRCGGILGQLAIHIHRTCGIQHIERAAMRIHGFPEWIGISPTHGL